MNDQLQVIVQEQGLEKTDIAKLVEAFGGPFDEAGEILATYKNIEVTDESQTDLMLEARTKRLALKKARTTVENSRKALKADIVKQGRAIDSVARYVKEEIQPAEEYLELQEKYAEIKRAEEKAKVLAERTEQLMQYTDDISLYNLDAMSDEKFTALLTSLKDQRDAAIAAEKKAEADRLAAIEAEQKRQAEIEKENARLRKEAEQREAELRAEREAAAKKQAKIDAELRKEREAKEAELRAERAKVEAIEAEQRAKREAEAKAQAEQEELERKALLSPDKDKLIKFCEALDTIRAEKLPAVKSNQAQEIVNQIEDALLEISNNAKKQARSL